ncbi:MAG: hypothetical protein KatS3mg035_1222 [Bacteroidia bacterium]|nr:MAG: hypothetical protein KatS3mg035_1222 [Bacteroidia bacterium]
MKSLILFIGINILLFSVSLGNNGKNKTLKNKKLEEIIKFPVHAFHLKKIKIQNLNIKKINYDKHERNYYLICKNPNFSDYKRVIFYVHGGGWILGKPENHLKLAEILSEQGFIVVLPAYRYAYQAQGTEMVEDLKKAYQSACTEIKNDYPNIEGVIIGGASAGGNLASLIALSDLPSIFPIKGLFSLSGVLDLSEIKENLIIKMFAKEPQSSHYQALNPINFLHSSQNQFPILCIHGTKDALVPLCSSTNFVEIAQTKTCHPIDFFYFEANHIDITSAWYYDTTKNYGQKELLIAWLLSL